MTRNWPELDYLGWRETCSALHLYLQIAGKYRLAHTPWLNHSWNATFYVTPIGLASSPIPDGPGIEILFDLREHRVVGTCGNGGRASFELGPITVAEFHARFVRARSRSSAARRPSTGSRTRCPTRCPSPRIDRDRPYDREAVQRFHQALVAVDRVFNRFRTSFLGKSSPVHLFWGALDLAVTRFSGRRAPLHPAGIPALPDDVAQEAYDREVSSAGFWPGGNGIDYPAFYAYAYPAPSGYRAASGPARRGVLARRPVGVRPPLRRRAVGGRSRRGADGLPRLDLRGRRRSGRLGPRSAGMRAWRAPPGPSRGRGDRAGRGFGRRRKGRAGGRAHRRAATGWSSTASRPR